MLHYQPPRFSRLLIIVFRGKSSHHTFVLPAQNENFSIVFGGNIASVFKMFAELVLSGLDDDGGFEVKLVIRPDKIRNGFVFPSRGAIPSVKTSEIVSELSRVIISRRGAPLSSDFLTSSCSVNRVTIVVERKYIVKHQHENWALLLTFQRKFTGSDESVLC